jgi:hypothetical protein
MKPSAAGSRTATAILAFLYQDRTAGGRKSRFAKFVDRDSVAARSAGDSGEH